MLCKTRTWKSVKIRTEQYRKHCRPTTDSWQKLLNLTAHAPCMYMIARSGLVNSTDQATRLRIIRDLVHKGVHVSNDKDRVTSNTKSHKPTATPSRELIWKTTAVAWNSRNVMDIAFVSIAHFFPLLCRVFFCGSLIQGESLHSVFVNVSIYTPHAENCGLALGLILKKLINEYS